MRSLSPNKRRNWGSFHRLAIINGVTVVASVCGIGAEDVGKDGSFSATGDGTATNDALVNGRDVWGRNAVEKLGIAT